ncbi:uncharacterized protein LOC112691408 [Sipha flava]|uniref:Uncharacterized protein LOC112691408 n=1 Tax=Sipha flava TaxID=143950 RepID=A0A8B8GDY7_9HEMI|nr:uncharacterized protein LOC112691408 [Sipha flava]
MSLYEALFGCKIKIGLNTSNLPHDVISTIDNEEQLAELITEQSQEINLNVENDVSNTEQPKEVNLSVDTEVDTEHLVFTTIRTTKKLNKKNANVMRTRAKENLENQAKKIMAWSDKKLLPVEVHSTVRVPVPEVDKGRGDARNILAIVLEELAMEF